MSHQNEEIRNFRDIGGQMTADGRRVKTGLLFRSAALDGLNEMQQAYIEQIGLKRIIDFRSGVERAVVAAPYSIADVDIWRSPDISTQGAPQHALDAFLALPAGDKSAMQDIYRRAPYVQAVGFTALYEAIAAADLPILFHCAAGKDRTGAAAALLLDLLGVPRDAIFADYRHSDQWFDHTRAEFLINFPDREAVLTREPHWRSMLETDESYLNAMFDEIAHRHGNTRAYMIEALEITPDRVDQIIDRLLE